MAGRWRIPVLAQEVRVTPAQSRIARWRDDPVAFVRECLGAEPDAWQVEVLRAFNANQRLALKACKGPGKSTVLAWLIWNFLLTRPHPKVVATSVTADNLHDGLWTELSKWQARSPILKAAFVWTATRIQAKDHPSTWWASARAWSKSADPSSQADTLAGIHAERVLFVIDEAGSVPDSVAAAAEAGLAVGKETKLVIAGNPTLLEGPLYRACTRERALWWVKEITGDPDAPDRAPRIDPKWAREQIEKYGRENPWVLVNVFGRFPPAQSNALLGVEEVARAMREVVGEHEAVQFPLILGVDVAREGDDRSVLFMRQGRVAWQPKAFRNLDLMELCGQVAEVVDKHHPDAVFVDETGLGAGVVDRLRQQGFPVTGVNFGRSCASRSGEPQFVNWRCAMWWRMAAWVKADGSLPDVPELVSELCAPTYDYSNAAGKFALESKDDIKRRGHPSPDLADALALTFAGPVIKRGVVDLFGAAHERLQREAQDYMPMVG
jgi:hypothetical protein